VSGEVVQTLDAHGGVLSAVFSPDGARIAAASDDGAARSKLPRRGPR